MNQSEVWDNSFSISTEAAGIRVVRSMRVILANGGRSDGVAGGELGPRKCSMSKVGVVPVQLHAIRTSSVAANLRMGVSRRLLSRIGYDMLFFEDFYERKRSIWNCDQGKVSLIASSRL